MTQQWGSPDLPPEPDAATLRELTRFEFNPVTHTYRSRPALPARDVPLVTDTGRRLINGQPVRPLGLDRQRRTPAVALVPVAVALCAVLALAGIGAAHVAVFAARHWIRALMLVAFCWAVSLLIRGCRRRG